MNSFELFDKLITLNSLICRGYTGTPDKLAQRLSISRSTLYRIIDELNIRGIEIKYCRTRCSFYYSNDVIMDLRFDMQNLSEINNQTELRNISGGMKNISFYPVFEVIEV